MRKTNFSFAGARLVFPEFSRALVVIAATLLLVALSGCSSRKDHIAQAVRAGIFHFGNGDEPQDLDPQIVTGIPEHKIIMTLFEGLVIENPKDLSPEPGVAERWTKSEDGRTYTFYLRKDARWSNGDPVTADDFLLSYKRIITPSIASEYANMIYDFVENAEDYYHGKITDFSKVGFKVIDPQTFEIRLKNPTPYFLNMLASHYSWWPVPAKVVQKFGGMETRGTAWTRPENFVCNGPFRLKEWWPNQKIIVEKSPTYWDRERVKLNEVHFYPVQSQDTEERMFRTGQLMRTNDLALAKIEVYRSRKDPSLHVEPWLGSYFYRFNVTRPPFTDQRVRRAFALAIDREAIVKNVTRGGQNPAYNFTPTGFPTYHPKARLTGTLEEARRLLAEAGYPEGHGIPPIEVLYNTHEGHRSVAEALQQMWRTNLNVNVTLVNQEWKVYLDSQDTLNYSICRAGWIADYADPHTFLEIFVTGGGNNDTGWSNAEYDQLREKALLSKTDDERFAIYERMEQILMDELPILPIYHYTKVYLLDPSVKGWTPNILDNHPYKFLSLDVGSDT